MRRILKEWYWRNDDKMKELMTKNSSRIDKLHFCTYFPSLDYLKHGTYSWVIGLILCRCPLLHYGPACLQNVIRNGPNILLYNNNYSTRSCWCRPVMEYKITSKRKPPKPKNLRTYIDILLRLLYIEETRLHDHGWMFLWHFMKIYKMC